MEILRGDLARLLRDACGPGVTYRFGDHVTRITRHRDGVEARFASGTVARYAFVAVAEGVGSRTRELVFPGENRPRWMHMLVAYFTIPKVDGDNRMWRWYHAGKGRSVSLRPDPHGTIRASLTLQGRSRGEQGWDAARVKSVLRARFADAGWQTPRVLDALDGTGDFYFDVLRQVRMQRWSKGRVVLCGDAAWCVTPLGGGGATLALVGAYVLAGELSRHDAGRPSDALDGYECVMRPLTDRIASIPRLVPRLFHPRTRLAVGVLRALLALVSRPAIQRRLGGRQRDAFTLPDYQISKSWPRAMDVGHDIHGSRPDRDQAMPEPPVTP